jgi:ubiquinone/menaquinone biosynthesis C-methylase UbiE
MRLDQQWIAERLGGHFRSATQPGILLDLGCGTGRALLPWSDRGWKTIGIDLSLDMLGQAQAKCLGSVNPPGFVHANLAQLQCLSENFADAAVCLYSSIGMIRGSQNRRSMLEGVRRALKQNGLFFVHAHNRGNWLRDPKGLQTTLASYFRSRWDRDCEFGDRVYAYRGLPSMFLHIFSRSELKRALRQAGFAIESIMLLNRTSSGPLRCRWCLPDLRAGGFMVIASNPACSASNAPTER